MSTSLSAVGALLRSRTVSKPHAHTGAVASAVILSVAASVPALADQTDGTTVELESPRVGVFFDFDAQIDGDGSAENPYNTMTLERAMVPVHEPGQHVYMWIEGEADALEWPAGVSIRADPDPDASPATLNVLSRHLVDPDAARGHVTWSVAIESEKMRIQQHLPGIFRVELPFDHDLTGVAGVLRDYREPDVTPIPPAGLPDGVAMNTDLLESYRLGPEPRAAVREAASFADLRTQRHGGWWLDEDAGRLFIKTRSGLPPGSPAVPEWRIIADRDGAMLSVNSFGTASSPRVRVGGLKLSLVVESPGGPFGRSRTLQINPATRTLVHDTLFMFCGSEDAIAAVNGGGPEDTVTVRRNQYVGVPRDGGAAVVATQGRSPPYEFVEYSDFVVHGGYTIRFEDGTDTGMLPFRPAGMLGTYHAGNVLGSSLERAIGLSYNGFSASPFQFPPIEVPTDPRERGAFNASVSDVHVENSREMFSFHANGLRVERSYFEVSSRLGFARELGTSLWESCVFEMPRAGRQTFNILGQIGDKPAAFSNCLVRYHGTDRRVALFGIASDDPAGRVYLRDMLVDLGGEATGMRFASGFLSHNAPPLSPNVIAGWDDSDPADGATDLGRHLFDRGVFFDANAGGSLDLARLEATNNPIEGGPSDSIASFVREYGNGITLFETQVDAPPGADIDAVAGLAEAIAGGSVSAFADGPTGIDGTPFAGAIGPFQAFAASPCRIADANGDGSVDMADVMAFVDLFLASDAGADVNGDAMVNVTDLFAFFAAYSDPACR